MREQQQQLYTHHAAAAAAAAVVTAAAAADAAASVDPACTCRHPPVLRIHREFLTCNDSNGFIRCASPCILRHVVFSHVLERVRDDTCYVVLKSMGIPASYPRAQQFWANQRNEIITEVRITF
jgi:hypothetical protein